MPRDPRALLPLPAHVLQILLALHAGDLHGYALLSSIEARTRGEMAVGTSTLYASLARLKKLGVIDEVDAPADADSEDARRRYYRVTAFGLEVMREEALRIRRLNRMISHARVLSAAPAGRGDA
jgi:DNA-binding PadR family transcriptional regulator